MLQGRQATREQLLIDFVTDVWSDPVVDASNLSSNYSFFLKSCDLIR